jgi:hypothetical protein
VFELLWTQIVSLGSVARPQLRILLKPTTYSIPKPATHNYPKLATDSTRLSPSVLAESNVKPSDCIHYR